MSSQRGGFAQTCGMQVAYTALGRLEAMAGRPEGALEAAKRSLAAGHQAKLRSFIPALKSFCAEGDFVQAFEASLLIQCTAAGPAQKPN